MPVWWRDPWTAKTDAELWLGFYTALTTSLRNQGIELKRSTTIKRNVALFSKNEWVTGAGKLHKYAELGLGFVQSRCCWRIGSTQLNRLFYSRLSFSAITL
jgi:hypothetical protein